MPNGNEVQFFGAWRLWAAVAAARYLGFKALSPDGTPQM